MANQFIIMFNDYPSEVCAPGTTEEQANARAKEIKANYIQKNGSQGMLYVRAYEVPVYGTYIPQVNVKCEIITPGGLTGTTQLNVVRVEREDDGSFTAVSDYWPVKD